MSSLARLSRAKRSLGLDLKVPLVWLSILPPGPNPGNCNEAAVEV